MWALIFGVLTGIFWVGVSLRWGHSRGGEGDEWQDSFDEVASIEGLEEGQLLLLEGLSPLAARPDWGALNKFQRSMTWREWEQAMREIYSLGGAWLQAVDLVEVADGDGQQIEVAGVRSRVGGWQVEFAPRTGVVENLVPPSRLWRAPAEFGAVVDPERPLAGVRIALDPGHIGGEFARMEERYFQLGEEAPVLEGEMVLVVAKHLRANLESLGAEVFLTRERNEPVTRWRPSDLLDLLKIHVAGGEEVIEEALRLRAERLFYRPAEIRARAELLSKKFAPDLTLCLHFNAEPWGDPLAPELVEVNHFHILINGGYSAVELALEDQSFEMFKRVLERTHEVELELALRIAERMAVDLALPAYEYHPSSPAMPTGSPYVWARNLLANRIFPGPVLFLEPYVMNSKEVYARVQLGDYEGIKEINGVERKSIFREYAEVTAAAVAEAYAELRR